MELTELPNAVLKPEDLDASDQSFLDAARLADQGRDIPADLIKSDAATEPKPAAPDVTANEAAVEAEPKPDTRPRDPITGKFIEKDKVETTPEATVEAATASQTAPESEYAAKQREKKEKETARLEKTWESVNQRKEELERRQAELDAREAEMRQPRQEQRQKARTDDGQEITSRMLASAAKDFKTRAKQALEAGDYDVFNEQNALADKTLEHAQQFYRIEQQEAQQTAFQQHGQVWEGHIHAAFKAEPDLAKADSRLSKEVSAVLEQIGKELWMFPDGFNKAVDLAKLRISAADYPDLLEANKRLKAENDRLNGLTTPTIGSVTTPPAKKSLDSMSTEESDAYFLREAAKIDRL